MMTESERFDTNRPNLCANLRWKGMFIWAERDATVGPTSDGFFWCQHTQNCLGPDGKLVEPTHCDSVERQCHCQE
ncbi:MAG: hypothetical protein KF868_11360 [Acidobacteria bacterium]|nr:hypothetical protein [Acidobacteriota bacterium]MCW5968756.1 hypothetical protein [Blastocatellales bacterium]